MQQATTIICRNCQNTFTGAYCNQCGEKAYSEHDKSLLHLIEEGFHFITHFEGKFFTTLRALFTQPGKLSADYCNGIRKKYFKPLSFFLMLVILYLIFPFFEGLNMRLHYHMNHPLYGSYATQKTEQIIASRQVDTNTFSQKFHVVSEKASKFLLFIIIPLVAFFPWLLLKRKRKMFYDHFIFSTEVNSMYLLWGFLVVPLIFYLMFSVLGWSISMDGELFSSLWILIPFALYLVFAFRRFYQLGYGKAILMTVGLIVWQSLILQFLYKFILFIISVHLV